MSEERKPAKKRPRSLDDEKEPTNKRYRPGCFDAIARDNAPKYRAMRVLVESRLYDEMMFLHNKPMRCCTKGDNRILAVVPVIDSQGRGMATSFWCSAFVRTEHDDLTEIAKFPSEYRKTISHFVQLMPVCVAFLMGMMPKAGRNESTWVEVDEDTRKRVRSAPDSPIHAAFVKHTLGERQLVREIFSFLY